MFPDRNDNYDQPLVDKPRANQQTRNCHIISNNIGLLSGILFFLLVVVGCFCCRSFIFYFIVWCPKQLVDKHDEKPALTTMTLVVDVAAVSAYSMTLAECVADSRRCSSWQQAIDNQQTINDHQQPTNNQQSSRINKQSTIIKNQQTSNNHQQATNNQQTSAINNNQQTINNHQESTTINN